MALFNKHSFGSYYVSDPEMALQNLMNKMASVDSYRNKKMQEKLWTLEQSAQLEGGGMRRKLLRVGEI